MHTIAFAQRDRAFAQYAQPEGGAPRPTARSLHTHAPKRVIRVADIANVPASARVFVEYAIVGCCGRAL